MKHAISAVLIAVAFAAGWYVGRFRPVDAGIDPGAIVLGAALAADTAHAQTGRAAA